MKYKKNILFIISALSFTLFFAGCDNDSTEYENSLISSWNEQVASQGSVSITAKPLNLANDAKTWDFEVALDTHSEELSVDLLQAVTLIDADGKEQKPFSWEGSEPGGHHRSGVLKFTPVDTTKLTLKIKGVSGDIESVLTWEL